MKTQIKRKLERMDVVKKQHWKSHLFSNIFDFRSNITLLKENNWDEKPAGSNNEKKKVFLLKKKINFLESENSFLKSEITIKKRVIDWFLEHNSNLLNITVDKYHKILTMKFTERVVKTKERS